MTYRGHVHNGVIVLDTQVNLAEGTPVRVETLVEQHISAERGSRAERYRELLQRLEEWNAQDAVEDGRLGDMLQKELAADHGVRFRDDGDLEKILTEP